MGIQINRGAEPWILGIGSSHNGAVCLLKGQEIVVAIQEERLSRIKRATHPAARNSLALAYCLETAGIQARDLSAIVVCSASPLRNINEDVSLNPALQAVKHGIPTFYISHHLGHAINAFATSGFRDATVLVVDGNGSPWSDLPGEERALVSDADHSRASMPGQGEVKEVISAYAANGGGLQPIFKQVSSRPPSGKPGMPYFWSLGKMYEAVGTQIFSSGLDGAGKVMGLAPFGTPSIPASDFFSFEGQRFVFSRAIPDRYTHNDRWPKRDVEYRNLAASVQFAIEHALLQLLAQIKCLSSASDLCYTGGVALNSVANEKLIASNHFQRVFITPAAEDSGTAIGAAYYGLWAVAGRGLSQRLVHDAMGRTYSDQEIESSLARLPGITVSRCLNTVDDTVQLLIEGNTVGWFQGRSELGPRALGQRSILCDPRRADMTGRLNAKVKFREGFRPFAPLVLLDHVEDWLECDPGRAESPFMLRVMSFRPEKRHLVPAVVHIDGTGRVQTVTRGANGALYELLRVFYERTGVPLLLNTSFNTAGEPIVETPEDAVWCLLFSGLDCCVVGDHLVRRSTAGGSPLGLYPILKANRVSLESPVIRGAVTEPTGEEPFTVHGGLVSFHPDLLSDFGPLLTDLRGPVLRILGSTRWGELVHFADPCTFEPLLRLANGKRTGWEILRELRTSDAALTETSLEQRLAKLVRASIVELHPCEVTS